MCFFTFVYMLLCLKHIFYCIKYYNNNTSEIDTQCIMWQSLYYYTQ